MNNSLKDDIVLKELKKQLQVEAVKEDLNEKLANKPKIKFENFVSHMKDKGIKFNIINEEKALLVLQDMNYYYKLSCYKRNFKKIEGKYTDLEFSYLVDMASVDMQLRYLLIETTLDIEHALKTYLMKDITNNDLDDGYRIVQRFIHKQQSNARPFTIEKLMENAQNPNHYQHEIYRKHKDNPSAWVLLEVMSFGDFINFFVYYYQTYPTKEFKISSMKGSITGVKKIRNAASHNNPILLNLNLLKLSHINNYIKEYAEELEIPEKIYKSAKYHDILNMFYAHEFFVKGIGSKKYRSNAFKTLIDRTNERFSYLESGNDVKEFFEIMDKVVDKYISKLV
ncbi:Abi family protein [Carnobacterium maltaromaticum]|uniref:Abi family protein n=1 Tax=Carnobacterium maltaromaticum TaxID=2751 RepID=UPI0039AFBE17